MQLIHSVLQYDSFGNCITLTEKKEAAYFSKARKAAGSTSGSSISVEVVAMPPLNIASKTALPTASTNLTLKTKNKRILHLLDSSLNSPFFHLFFLLTCPAHNKFCYNHTYSTKMQVIPPLPSFLYTGHYREIRNFCVFFFFKSIRFQTSLKNICVSQVSNSSQTSRHARMTWISLEP